MSVLSIIDGKHIESIETYSCQIPSTIERIVKTKSRSKMTDNIVRNFLETYYGFECYMKDDKAEYVFQLSPGEKQLIGFISLAVLQNTNIVNQIRTFKELQNQDELGEARTSKCPMIETQFGYLFSDDPDDQTTAKRKISNETNACNNTSSPDDLPSQNSVNGTVDDEIVKLISEYLQKCLVKSSEKYLEPHSKKSRKKLEKSCSVDSECVSLFVQSLEHSGKNAGQKKLTVNGTIKCCLCKRPISVKWISNVSTVLLENICHNAEGKQAKPVGFWNVSNISRHLGAMHKNVGMF